MKSLSTRIPKTIVVLFVAGLLLLPTVRVSFAASDSRIILAQVNEDTGDPDAGPASTNVTGGGGPTTGGTSASQTSGVTGGGGPTNPVPALSGLTGGGGPTTGSGGVFAITNPLHAQSIGELVLDVIQIFSYIAILFGALAIIWVGFQYILASSQGKADKISELHGYFLAIIIGLAIVIGASAIIHVLLNTLKATGTVNQSILDSANKAAQFK